MNEQKVRKAFRLSEEAVDILDKRDPVLYKSETDFVEAAIVSFGKTNCLVEEDYSSRAQLENLKKQLMQLEKRVSDLEGGTAHEKFKLPDISGLDMEE